MKRADSPDVRFAKLAALWAQKIGLPFGNLWEPAIARYLLSEFNRLGADANAYAFVTAHNAHRLGIDLEATPAKQ